MWVIYNADTGEEIDREEHWDDAMDIIRNFNDTNTWGYTATYRQER